MEGSARPEWLEDNGESPTPPEWLEDNGETPTPSTGANTSSLSIDQFGESKTDESAEKKSRFCSFGCFLNLINRTCVLNLISLAFAVLFVYSAIVQTNDSDAIQWIIFYSVNAAVPVLFVVQYTFCSCLPVKLTIQLSVVSAIWSIVYIVISSVNVRDVLEATSATDAAVSANATDAAVSASATDVGDNDNQTLLEEAIFENAGASIGLLSALYHIIVAKCCIET